MNMFIELIGLSSFLMMGAGMLYSLYQLKQNRD